MDEAFLLFFIHAEMGREKFGSDEAVELGVLGLIDHTHSPAAEFFEDFVVRNNFADHCIHTPFPLSCDNILDFSPKIC